MFRLRGGKTFGAEQKIKELKKLLLKIIEKRRLMKKEIRIE